MTEKLDPCPLCGGIPRMVTAPPGEHGGRALYLAACKCGLIGGYCFSEEDAVNAWNRMCGHD